MRAFGLREPGRGPGDTSAGRTALASGFIAATLLAPAQAAEPAGSNGATELDVIVVTATRSAQSLADAPAAVTVVDERQIEAKPVSRLGDALDQVPSLYLQNGAFGASQGTSGTSNLSLRGIDQSRVLILLDGQPIQDASSGKVNWRIPFMDDIARIEVVPGAFSSLYGSNAIGGVINVITKQPETREATLKLSKGWQDLAGEDASVYFRNKWDNGLGVVVGAGYQNRDSYVNEFVVKTACTTPACLAASPTPVTGWQSTTTRDGTPAYLVGDKGRIPWTSAHAVFKLSYALNTHERIHAGISWQETEQGYTPFTTYLRNSVTGLPVSTGTLGLGGQRISLTLFDFVNNSPLHEAATRYFAGYEGTVGIDKRLRIDVARIDRAYYFTAANPGAPTYEGGSGTLTDTPNSGLDGTIQLSFPVGERHFWVTGIAFHGEEVEQRVYALSNWRDEDTRTALNNGYNGRSSTVSLFAQDEIVLGGTLKAFLGGRWDSWQTQGDTFKLTAPATSAEYPQRRDSAFSPKASLVWQPVDNATLRASLGRAFRAPPNLDLYSTTTVRCILVNGNTGSCTLRANPDLDPETGTTWELGGDWRFSPSTQAGLTLYETRLKDLIYTKRTPGNFVDRINAGEARVRGVELTARTRLASWLQLDANYAWIDSEMLANPADPTSVGKRLTQSPEHIAGIALTAWRGPWSGTLDARYSSHVHFTADNSDVVEGVPGSYDAYTMVNAKVGYAFSKTVTSSLSIRNLLDEKAYSFFLLPGRSAVAELAFNF